MAAIQTSVPQPGPPRMGILSRLPMLPALLGLWLSFFFAGNAEAHRLQVFAYAEGLRIQGSVYFSGGKPAAELPIRIDNLQTDHSEQTHSDAQGHFQLRVETAADYRIVVESGDGHRAQWTLAATEFSANPTRPTTNPSAAPPRDDKRPVTPTLSNCVDPQPALDPAPIEQALARQLGPLRAELHAYRQEARLSDLIGGIGFIVGLAGAGLWWRSRKPSA